MMFVKESDIDIVHVSNTALTLNNEVQLIVSNIGEAEKVTAAFDFKHSMGYRYFNDNEIKMSQKTRDCILNKELKLNLNSSKDRMYQKGVFTSRGRIEKFLRRGFTLSNKEIEKANEFMNKEFNKNFSETVIGGFAL